MHSRSTLIIQTSQADMCKNKEFDTVYHEHLSYFSILPLIKWTEEHDLEIFDIIKQDVHGGSLRIFVSKKGNFQRNNSVKKLVQNEYDLGLDKIVIYKKFSKDVEELKTKLKNILNQLKKENKTKEEENKTNNTWYSFEYFPPKTAAGKLNFILFNFIFCTITHCR